MSLEKPKKKKEGPKSKEDGFVPLPPSEGSQDLRNYLKRVDTEEEAEASGESPAEAIEREAREERLHSRDYAQWLEKKKSKH